MEEIHGTLANAWLIVVGLHVLGVVFSSIAHRENLVKAMLTGYKQGAGSRRFRALPQRWVSRWRLRCLDSGAGRCCPPGHWRQEAERPRSRNKTYW